MKTSTSLAILASLSGVSAFWRMECRGRAGLARIDPLMNPGGPAQHAHAIHGSSAFSATSSYDDLRNGECTSCAVTEDMSAYWAPGAYFRHANGTYEEVNQVGGMLAYYFLNPDMKDPNKPIKAFPNNFRMIAGDSTRRNYTIDGLDVHQPDPAKSDWGKDHETTQVDLAQRALGFNCLNYHGNAEPTLWRHYLPDKAFLDANCLDGVRFELAFPSCWNGRDITSDNFKSHVAYPDTVINGNCPEGFDVKLPGLMYETIYDTAAFKGIPGEFVMANGDVEGFGYHGDFISGWKEEFLQAAVEQCTNLSGRIEDCSLFTIRSEDEQRQCKLTSPPLIIEKLLGFIGDILPGGVEISRGPGPAIPKPHGAPAPIPLPAVSSVVPGLNVLPGGAFAEKSTSEVAPTPSSTSTTSTSTSTSTSTTPSTTSTPVPSDPPVPKGYSLVRTDYVTKGNVVSKIVVIETVKYVMAEATETVTVTATRGTDKARREVHHMHQHQHRHHHGAH
ncbi:hypothetical protein B0J18DRAFT_476939 [Chaetomium sp. MPI-SDFR-AT-0129]|nr:hypothetical protein B0J18DRAFT_476939 [Chaetomium sp. MPI-SDFR-AT-0129]